MTTQSVENETNEAVYVKDGLMTWEIFQQALLLISLPLISILLAFLLVFLVKGHLTDPKRLIPHYKYAYQKNVKECNTLWEQQNLPEFKTCLKQLKLKILEFTEHYEKVQISEQAKQEIELTTEDVSKLGFLDEELFNELKQRLYSLDKNGEIPETVVDKEPVQASPAEEIVEKTEVIVAASRDSVINAGEISKDIYNMTDIEEILKWCSVLKSRAVVGPSQIEAPECYKRVLELDPKNYTARHSIRRIKVKYTQWAMKALANAESGKTSFERALGRAKTNIDRVKAINPDDDVLADLIRRYENLEKQLELQMMEECRDLLNLALNSGRIAEQDKVFIKQNCPASINFELERLLRENTTSSIFGTEENE
jgi:hypothetical protein